MIQMRTVLKAADNSGAKEVRCIKALGGFNRTFAYAGNYIVVSVRSIRLVRKVKVGEIYLGILMRTAKSVRFLDGSFSKFKTNSVVLLNRKKRIVGTRLFGPVSKNLRTKKLFRIVIMSGRNII